MSHLSSVMDDVGAWQGRAKEAIPRKTRSSSNSFGQSRLTCFCSLRLFHPPTPPFFIFYFLAAFWGTTLARLHVWRDLLDCGGEVNSKRVCVCSSFVRARWQPCDFLPYSQFFLIFFFFDLLLLSLFMTFLHFSPTISFKLRDLDCAANYCTAPAITGNRKAM